MDILVVKSKKRPQQNFYCLNGYVVVPLTIGTTLIYLCSKELSKKDHLPVHGPKAAGKVSKLKEASWLATKCQEDYWSKTYKSTLDILEKEIDLEWEEKRSISGFVYLEPITLRKYWVSHYDLDFYKKLENNI